MGFSQVDGFLKLGYDFTPHWRAYVDANIVHFKSSYPGPTSAPLYGAEQWITRGTVEAAGPGGETILLDSAFGAHDFRDRMGDPEKPTQRYFRSKDALTGISWYQSVVLGNLESAFQTRLTVGIDYQHIFGHAYYTSKATGEVLDTPNKQSGRSRRNDVAGYVDVRQDFTEWLTVDAGLRLDHHSVTGSQWIPQFGVVVRPLKSGELKAMASKGFRNPTMREMYLYPPSNEELRPEKLWSYELSWRQRLASVSYGANIYYIKGDNMIQTVNRKNVNTGVIENCGIELDATWQIDKHWSATTNHSLLHMVHKVVAAPEYKGFLGAGYRKGLEAHGAAFVAVDDDGEDAPVDLVETGLVHVHADHQAGNAMEVAVTAADKPEVMDFSVLQSEADLTGTDIFWRISIGVHIRFSLVVRSCPGQNNTMQYQDQVADCGKRCYTVL